MKRLPSPQEVNRLYWFEEMSLAQIGKKFDVKFQTVYLYMKRHKIPTRKVRVAARPHTECVECGADVCRIKYWHEAKKVYAWRYANRCLAHFLQFRRERHRARYQATKTRGTYRVQIRESNWAREA